MLILPLVQAALDETEQGPTDGRHRDVQLPGVDVARFNRFVAEELKPTYRIGAKTGRFKPRVKKTRCLAVYGGYFYPRATGWCDSR